MNHLPNIFTLITCFILTFVYLFLFFFKEILDAINSNQVVVISGETGCGKTTQVGRYLGGN